MTPQMWRLRDRPFKQQLGLVIALAVLSLALVSSVATSWQSGRNIRANMVEEGMHITESLASQSRLALIYGSPENADKAVSVTMLFPDVTSLEIRYADGRLLLHRDKQGVSKTASADKVLLTQRQPYLETETADAWHFVAPVLSASDGDSPFEVSKPQQEVLGFVHVVLSKATLSRMRNETFVVNFAVSFLFAFLILFIVHKLTTRLTVPLDRLSSAMALAQRGVSNVRTEPSGPKDIVDMGHAFNKMMASLEEQKRDLQTLLDNLPAAVIVHGPDAAIRYANPVARTFLGRSTPQILGQGIVNPAWLFLRADGSVMPQEEYPASLVISSRESLHDYTMGLVSADDDSNPRWFSVSAFPETSDEDELEQIIVCLVDITERKQYELALEVEAQEWTQAMDAFPDIIYMVDVERRLVRANRQFYALTRSNPADAVGKPIVELIHRPGEERDCPVCRAQENRHDATLTLEADHPANSTHHPIEVTVKVIRDKAGEPHYFLTAIHDLTSVRKYEEELRRLNESLEQRVQEEVAKNRDKDGMLIQQSRLATMGEMMHNVAHQWRQPLSALTLILSNIRDEYEFGDMTEESLKRHVSQGQMLAKKMSSTIDDFRNFFRPDQATSRFDISESMRQALNLVDASFRNANIEVALNAPRAIQVDGYANEFSQVLLNVLANAKDVFDHRKIHGKLAITVENSGHHGVVRIRDNGGGIPESVLPKIFDPYFTTKESGTGIGLYMSRMIMSHMHGYIEAHNVDGGAEFVISVPLATDSGNPVPQGEHP